MVRLPVTSKTVYVCSQCGHTEPKWTGHCPDCGAWNSFAEEVVRPTSVARRRGAKSDHTVAQPISLAAVASSAVERFSSGIAELDLVLGGGIVPGSLVLVGGEPGIGKSTLLLQALDRISRDRPTLIVCGEESAAQVRMRAERVCASGLAALRVLAETELSCVLGVVAAERPAVVVIDSVQTLYTDDLTSAPGSVSQVREAAGRFLRLAKETGTAVVLVGHVTKDGAIAGPRVLEHMVDTVLQFEGDRNRFFRVLRAVKNRFGSTNEVGVFEMTEQGLKGVSDPSRLFLAEGEAQPGSCAFVAVEGSRCFLVEVQALVSASELALPRRVATGFDRNRLAMIVAVLSRHAHMALASADIFVNIAGGMRLEEPAADLAVALAIASAERGVPLGSATAAFGEISLTGELRSSSQPHRRLSEAVRLGFDTVVMSQADARRARTGTAAVVGVADIRGALRSVQRHPAPRRQEARQNTEG